MTTISVRGRGNNKNEALHDETGLQGRPCAAAGLVFSLEVETAKAGGFAVRERSAETLGEAFAGVALARWLVIDVLESGYHDPT
jgi:hypothetical protein